MVSVKMCAFVHRLNGFLAKTNLNEKAKSLQIEIQPILL